MTSSHRTSQPLAARGAGQGAEFSVDFDVDVDLDEIAAAGVLPGRDADDEDEVLFLDGEELEEEVELRRVAQEELVDQVEQDEAFELFELVEEGFADQGAAPPSPPSSPPGLASEDFHSDFFQEAEEDDEGVEISFSSPSHSRGEGTSPRQHSLGRMELRSTSARKALDLQRQNQELERKTQALEGETMALEFKLEQVRSSLEDSQRALMEMESHSVELQQERDVLLEQLHSLEAQATPSREEAPDRALLFRVQTLEQALEQARERHQAARGELSQARAEGSKLRAEAERATRLRAHADERVARLEEIRKEQDTRLSDMEVAAARSSKELAHLEDALRETQQAHAALQELHRRDRDLIPTLELRLQQAQDRLELLTLDVSDGQHAAEDLQGSLQAALEGLEAAQHDVAALQQALQEAQAQAQAHHDHAQQALAQAQELQQELEQEQDRAQLAISRAAEQLIDLQRQLQLANDALAGLQEQRDLARQELQRARADAAREQHALQQELLQARAARDELLQARASLAQELFQERAQAEQLRAEHLRARQHTAQALQEAEALRQDLSLLRARDAEGVEDDPASLDIDLTAERMLDLEPPPPLIDPEDLDALQQEVAFLREEHATALALQAEHEELAHAFEELQQAHMERSQLLMNTLADGERMRANLVRIAQQLSSARAEAEQHTQERQDLELALEEARQELARLQRQPTSRPVFSPEDFALPAQTHSEDGFLDLGEPLDGPSIELGRLPGAPLEPASAAIEAQHHRTPLPLRGLGTATLYGTPAMTSAVDLPAHNDAHAELSQDFYEDLEIDDPDAFSFALPEEEEIGHEPQPFPELSRNGVDDANYYSDAGFFAESAQEPLLLMDEEPDPQDAAAMDILFAPPSEDFFEERDPSKAAPAADDPVAALRARGLLRACPIPNFAHAARMDHRAGFFMGSADGATSVEDLLDLSGMPIEEAAVLVADLLDRGALQVT
jgi:hypothetical protein